MTKPTVTAVIPVKGRHPLLRQTVQRLIHKNNVTKVILVTSDQADKAFCLDLVQPDQIVHCKNTPLGTKWNRGFHLASFDDPDYYIMMGSGSWISDNWVEKSIEYSIGYDMVGTSGMHLWNNGPADWRRLCHWEGEEPTGTGRLISKRVMEKLCFTPFSGHLNSGLERSMLDRVRIVGGQIRSIKDDSMVSLSISDHRWKNIHQFEQHWSGKIPSTQMEQPDSWMNVHFPEWKLI